jgi:hypothetical protein
MSRLSRRIQVAHCSQGADAAGKSWSISKSWRLSFGCPTIKAAAISNMSTAQVICITSLQQLVSYCTHSTRSNQGTAHQFVAHADATAAVQQPCAGAAHQHQLCCCGHNRNTQCHASRLGSRMQQPVCGLLRSMCQAFRSSCIWCLALCVCMCSLCRAAVNLQVPVCGTSLV